MLFCLCLIGGTIQSFAQQKDTVVNFDQLRAPSSPAFNLLGISPSDIERPKNPTDFAFSLSNASNSFSTVPKSYAMEISPFWAFNGKSTFKQFIDNKNIGNNIKQTLVFSVGSTTAKAINDSSEFRQIGLAFKFSILRGKVGDEFTKWDKDVTEYLGQYDTYYAHLKDSLTRAKDSTVAPLLKLYVKYKPTDPEAVAILKAVQTMNDEIDVKVRALSQDTASAKNKIWLTKLRELSNQTSFRRYGFTMDWAAGTVIDFADSTFNRSYLSKFATWLTFGYEGHNGSNIMFLLRYAASFNRFYRNDLNIIVKDINIGNLDMGLRFYQDFNDKLTISVEYIHRLPFYNGSAYLINHVSSPSKTDKYDFSLNYKVGKNQNLSFTYGKNFDNTTTKTGNLIAAVSFVIGLGSARGISR